MPTSEAFETEVDHYGPPHAGCDLCARNTPFDLPDTLLASIAAGRVVIFAGAGVSTEARAVLGFTFYEDIADELALPHDTPFPDVISAFQQKHGRGELLRRILERLEAAEAFRSMRASATRFHRELATIPQFRNIVTTNWDTLFERYSSALPMVTAADFAFWDLPRRKVFKIHGSLSNVGTLIASREDYARRARELSRDAFGAPLKLLLATRIPLFIGYSFRDPDSEQVYRYLSKEIGDILPQAYVVTHGPNPPPAWLHANVIRTDGAYFLARIKRELITKAAMLDPRRFAVLHAYRERAVRRQNTILRTIPRSRWPSMIYTTSYQDGLLDALDYGAMRSQTGDTNDPRFLEEKVHAYQHLYRGAMRRNRYFDAAYIAGFNMGMLYLSMPVAPFPPPLNFVFPSGPVRSVREWERLVKRSATRTPRMDKAARRIVESQAPRTILHHTPTLHGVQPE